MLVHTHWPALLFLKCFIDIDGKVLVVGQDLYTCCHRATQKFRPLPPYSLLLLFSYLISVPGVSPARKGPMASHTFSFVFWKVEEGVGRDEDGKMGFFTAIDHGMARWGRPVLGRDRA